MVQHDLIHVEVIGDDNQPVPAGTPGEVVVTPFGVEGMPLLRFRTGDICAWHEGAGPNGYERRLGPVLGRKQQRLVEAPPFSLPKCWMPWRLADKSGAMWPLPRAMNWATTGWW